MQANIERGQLGDALFFFYHAEDCIRDTSVTGVQTCALPIWSFRTRPRQFTKHSSASLALKCSRPKKARLIRQAHCCTSTPRRKTKKNCESFDRMRRSWRQDRKSVV